MATAKWATPSATSSNIAGTALNSLTAGTESPAISYDNSSYLDLYAAVTVELGSITPTNTPAYLTLRVYHSGGSGGVSAEDISGDGESYTRQLKAGTGAKRVIFPMVRLYPWALTFTITNGAGVSLASSGNAVYVRPYNEAIA